MQHKYRFLWLALIPFGAAGALATGMVSLPWQISGDNLEVGNTTDAAKPGTSTASAQKASPTGSKTSQTTGSRLAALDKQSNIATRPENETPANSELPSLSAKKQNKFGIDIARINPEGSSVIAGHAAPGKPITVMADGEPVGVVTPDASGDWVLITPHKFTNLDAKISLKPGDHMAKRVAALESRPTANAATEIKVDAKPQPATMTASQVTQQMMQRLKTLTRETVEAQTETKKVEEREQRLALAAPPSRLGGPSTEQKAGTASRPSASPPVPSVPERKVAAAPAPSLPTALQLGRPEKSAQATPAALTEALPVPVQFVYRKDVFTDQGREAAQLLLEYFKARKFSSVVLSGHADERGTTSANFKLSEQRLARIRQFLRDGGYAGRLKLVPKGETKKFTGVDRSKFSAEELYQLDRRVEVMSAR